MERELWLAQVSTAKLITASHGRLLIQITQNTSTTKYIIKIYEIIHGTRLCQSKNLIGAYWCDKGINKVQFKASDTFAIKY